MNFWDFQADKLREVTIRYKDFEWSFSCVINDFNGHGSGSHQSPHYHFQMRQGPRSIIRYNDFHVLFSDDDVREISAEIANPNIKLDWSYGEGMKDMLRPEIIERLLDGGGLTPATEGAGDIEFDHMVVADDGTTMKGEDIYAVIQESNKTGVSIGTLLRKGRIPNAKVTTIFSRGPTALSRNPDQGAVGKWTSQLTPIIFIRMNPSIRRDLALFRQLDHVLHGRRVSVVCTENSNPNVVMVKPPEDWM